MKRKTPSGSYIKMKWKSSVFKIETKIRKKHFSKSETKIAQKLFATQKNNDISIKTFKPTCSPKAEGYLLYILYYR